jgi:hypothetical protein
MKLPRAFCAASILLLWTAICVWGGYAYRSHVSKQELATSAFQTDLVSGKIDLKLLSLHKGGEYQKAENIAFDNLMIICSFMPLHLSKLETTSILRQDVDGFARNVLTYLRNQKIDYDKPGTKAGLEGLAKLLSDETDKQRLEELIGIASSKP